MVEKAKTKGRGKKPSGTPRRRKGVKLRPTELGATELALATPPAELEELAAAVRADGGAVLAIYREPLGGHALMLDGAARRQGRADAVPARHLRRPRAPADAGDGQDEALPGSDHRGPRADGDAAYWTPNGYHRLTALKELGAKTVLALLVPERPVAYQILALNIEKAHNLREKAIGVRRMYIDLAPISDGDEESFALEFEEPALATLGFAYEERGRLSGGAYHSILRKVDKWLPGKLAKAMSERRERAGLLLAYDEAVTEAIAALKARGFNSPYLRNFVVARSNPLRFIKGEPPPIEELLPSMTKRVKGMDVGKIKNEDVARTGGAAEATE